MSKLNPRQLQFCYEYLKDFNATQAAIRSGYSDKSARAIACELLTKPNIKAEINYLSSNLFNSKILTLDRIIGEVVSIAFSNCASDGDKLRALALLLHYRPTNEEAKRDLEKSALQILDTLRNMKKKRTV